MISLRPPSRLHAFSWFAFLFILVSFAYLKTAENDQSRKRLDQWRKESALKEAESFQKKDRLVSLIRSLQSKANSREVLEKKLNLDEPFEFQQKGTTDIVHWTHPQYGILVELKFEGSTLKGSAVQFGTAQLHTVLPRPDMISRHSGLERARKSLTQVVWPLWLAVFAISAFFFRRKTYLAEGAVAASLAYAVFLAVSPWYSLTPHGLLSNDRLGVAIMLFLLSSALLIYRIISMHSCQTVRTLV